MLSAVCWPGPEQVTFGLARARIPGTAGLGTIGVLSVVDDDHGLKLAVFAGARRLQNLATLCVRVWDGAGEGGEDRRDQEQRVDGGVDPFASSATNAALVMSSAPGGRCRSPSRRRWCARRSAAS
jgi:hypothetical protein